MALPTTRDITVSPTSPIPSALANKLQDMITGWKFPAMDFPHPACDWRPQGGGSGLLGDGQWTFGGLTILMAKIRLPVGTLISSCTFGYNRGGAGTIDVYLKKRNIVTGAAVVVVATSADVTGSAWETAVLNPAYTVEADFSVWLETRCSNGANIFGGAKINASRL